jgi:hypothetical protein
MLTQRVRKWETARRERIGAAPVWTDMPLPLLGRFYASK